MVQSSNMISFTTLIIKEMMSTLSRASLPEAKIYGNFQVANNQQLAQPSSGTTRCTELEPIVLADTQISAHLIHDIQLRDPIGDFEKLLQDPNFILLHVEPNETIRVYNPSHNKVKELEYRCISHLWGKVEEDVCVWDKHEISGIYYPIRFRPEKREKLLHVMREHGGYWWVDLLCIDQIREDKPLYLMEDIYRYCKECVAMVDCQVDVLEELSLKDLKETARRISTITISMIADDASFEQSEWGNTELDSPNSVFSGELAYLAGMRVCSKSLAEVTMALFESTWFTRIWTLQESVLPSTIVLTHETTGFNGRIDLLSALDLVQELRNYFCRYGYALSNEFEEDNPGFNKITSAAQMSGSGASQQYIDSDDSMDDTESVASDSVRGENRKVFYVGPILKSDAIPEDRDEDAYFFNRDFKVLYNSIANIIKLRSNPDLLGIIKVITGLNRRCEKTPDYFYGIAGLVGLKLKSGQDVRKLFYIFVNKLVAMNDNVAWEKPDWSNKVKYQMGISFGSCLQLSRLFMQVVDRVFFKILRLFFLGVAGV